MITCRPSTEIFKYTAFRTHVEERCEQWTKSGQLESVARQTLLIPDGNNDLRKKALIEIIGDGRIDSILGRPNPYKTACLRRGFADCTTHSYVPYWFNLEGLDPLLTVDYIYATLANRIGETRTSVEEIIRHSPPIIFFFDLSEAGRVLPLEWEETLDQLSFASRNLLTEHPEIRELVEKLENISYGLNRNFPPQSAEALVDFIDSCQHKFVIAYESRTETIDEILRERFGKDKLSVYEFQPNLDEIAKNDTSKFQGTLQSMSQAEIKRYLSDFDFKHYPTQQKKLQVIEAIAEKLTEHRYSEIHALVRDILTRVTESPDFKRRQKETAQRGLEKLSVSSSD